MNCFGEQNREMSFQNFYFNHCNIDYVLSSLEPLDYTVF